MQWDGTFLGYITKHQILDIMKHDRETYWRLQVKEGTINTSIICRVKTAKDTLFCIADELKQLFGLPKVGSHWVRMGKKIIILSRVDSDKDHDVLVYNKLSAFDKDIYPDFAEEVRNIFAFKQAFGIKYATLNAVKIVKIPDREEDKDDELLSWCAQSVKDTHLVKETTNGLIESVVKSSMLKLWFSKDDTMVRIQIHKLFKMRPDNFKLKWGFLKLKINDTIKRVDKERVTYGNIFEKRISYYFS